MARQAALADGGLERVRAELERWRGNPSRGRCIPEAIWREAVSLVESHGSYRVARALCLNYESLKRRVQDSTNPRSGAFVRLSLPASLPASTAVASVELESPGGAKLTVRLPGHSASEVALVAGALWSGRVSQGADR